MDPLLIKWNEDTLCALYSLLATCFSDTKGRFVGPYPLPHYKAQTKVAIAAANKGIAPGSVEICMNILSMEGQIFDLDEVRTSSVEASCIRLTFRNGDTVVLRWRDERERGDILRAVATGIRIE